MGRRFQLNRTSTGHTALDQRRINADSTPRARWSVTDPYPLESAATIYIYTNFIQRYTIEFSCLTVASHWSPGCWAPAKPGSQLLEALCRELLNNEACNIQNVPQSINFGSTLNQRWFNPVYLMGHIHSAFIRVLVISNRFYTKNHNQI